MKKTVILFVAIALAMALTVPAAAGPFADVPADHWAYDAVSSSYAGGILQGYPDGTFRGTDNITRYEISMVIDRLLDKVDDMTVEEMRRELRALKVRFDLATDNIMAVPEIQNDIAALEDMIADLEDDTADLRDIRAGLRALQTRFNLAIGDIMDIPDIRTDVEDIKADVEEIAQLRSRLRALNVRFDLAIADIMDIPEIRDDVAALKDDVEDLQAVTFSGSYDLEFSMRRFRGDDLPFQDDPDDWYEWEWVGGNETTVIEGDDIYVIEDVDDGDFVAKEDDTPAPYAYSDPFDDESSEIGRDETFKQTLDLAMNIRPSEEVKAIIEMSALVDDLLDANNDSSSLEFSDLSVDIETPVLSATAGTGRAVSYKPYALADKKLDGAKFDMGLSDVNLSLFLATDVFDGDKSDDHTGKFDEVLDINDVAQVSSLADLDDTIENLKDQGYDIDDYDEDLFEEYEEYEADGYTVYVAIVLEDDDDGEPDEGTLYFVKEFADMDAAKAEVPKIDRFYYYENGNELTFLDSVWVIDGEYAYSRDGDVYYEEDIGTKVDKLDFFILATRASTEVLGIALGSTVAMSMEQDSVSRDHEIIAFDAASTEATEIAGFGWDIDFAIDRTAADDNVLFTGNVGGEIDMPFISDVGFGYRNIQANFTPLYGDDKDKWTTAVLSELSGFHVTLAGEPIENVSYDFLYSNIDLEGEAESHLELKTLFEDFFGEGTEIATTFSMTDEEDEATLLEISSVVQDILMENLELRASFARETKNDDPKLTYAGGFTYAADALPVSTSFDIEAVTEEAEGDETQISPTFSVDYELVEYLTLGYVHSQVINKDYEADNNFMSNAVSLTLEDYSVPFRMPLVSDLALSGGFGLELINDEGDLNETITTFSLGGEYGIGDFDVASGFKTESRSGDRAEDKFYGESTYIQSDLSIRYNVAESTSVNFGGKLGNFTSDEVDDYTVAEATAGLSIDF